MKPLTEAQAWAVIAMRFGAASSYATGHRNLLGICAHIADLQKCNLITETVANRMNDRKNSNKPSNARRASYWWLLNQRGTYFRRDFCMSMASLADEEGHRKEEAKK
jgi:hypothetical protein